MTVSLSFTIVNTYAPQSAPPAAAVERKTPAVQDNDAGCEHKRPPSRQNRLADAMMSALRELGFGATAPAASAAITTTATPAKADAASAADASGRVESAVQQFAHALFQALRQGGSGSKNSEEDSGRVAGQRHHRRGEGQGYGNLSQRLEALSQTVAAPATAATPAAAPAPTPSVDATPAAAPVAAGTTPPAASIAVPVATAAKTPLLDAFTKLFNALKPAATDNMAATPATDMSEKLRQFLQSLAQALAPDTSGSVQRAQLGGLVNLTA